jgi:hypothetical protein
MKSKSVSFLGREGHSQFLSLAKMSHHSVPPEEEDAEILSPQVVNLWVSVVRYWNCGRSCGNNIESEFCLAM